MASTSSTPPRNINYDVFLSFRGTDTRKKFVDHLYNQLVQKGICTFKDDEKLEKGQQIEELLRIIKESRFAIVVFSKDYASSKWCLEEIATIMECQQQYGEKIVIPIFYDVEPTVVGNQKGSFAESFAKHEEDYKNDTGKVKRWRNALRKACSLSGHHLKNDYNGFEGKCVENVTKDIFTRLNQSIQASTVLENNFVGLESRVGYVGKMLTQEPDDVQFIGIWGMGGIGKTTTAMVVFNKFSSQFDGACFLDDIKQHKITELQKALLEKLLKEKMEISNEVDGMNKIERWLGEKKVLIVLDDVDQVEQLQKLAGYRNWFGRGSRVIITTRDAGVLRSHRVDKKYVYEVHTLEAKKAIQLFSCYAFKSKIPAIGFEVLSKSMVKYANGLPLALRVLGSSLCGLEAAEWESTLEEFKGTPNDNIINTTLKISYDRLDSKNKKIFVDIACFFRHQEKEHVKHALKSCGLQPGVIGMRVLIEKSFISVQNGRIEMHDLIQEMGWDIARQENPRSRVWEFKEVDDVLRGKMDPKHIECILFPYTYGFGWHNDENINSGFEALKILIGKWSHKYNEEDNNFEHILDNFLPSSLRWLHFPYYPFPSLPTSFHPSAMDNNPLELVGFFLHRSFLENCRITKELNKLTYLNLSSSCSLLETPNFDMMPNLERLYLSGCEKLKEIHPSIGHLQKLVLLDLSNCYKLEKLPCFVQVLSLQFLKLEHCRSLENFPEIKTSMRYVVELNLESIGIKELPLSIRQLCGLTKLRLFCCENLVCLSDDLCELESLKILELRRCGQLESLPENLGKLSKLEELHVFHTAIFQLPSSITQLSSLECLYWEGNRKFKKERTLKFVSGLGSLKRLQLSGFNILDQGFPLDLGCLILLEYLNLRGSDFVDLPESFSQLPHLQYLDIRNCEQLKELPKFPETTREIYADSRFASTRNINKLAECPELHSVAFSNDYQLFRPVNCLAKMCFHFPFFRKTPFIVSYPCYPRRHHDDEDPHTTVANDLRLFQYRCYLSNRISIDLNPSWYCQSFVGFLVSFLSSDATKIMKTEMEMEIIMKTMEFSILNYVDHCTVIAKLSHKDNGNEVLQRKCVIPRISGHICFAYIPFSSLWPAESNTNTNSVTPKDFSRFEVEFMNLEATANWGCSLLYRRREKPASWDDCRPGCTTDIGPLGMLEYLNLSGKEFEHFLPEDISGLCRLQYLDISGCRRLREGVPELPATIRELYANSNLASESNIAELASKYSELYSISFSDGTVTLSAEELARKFVHVPFQIRNSPFVVTYPACPGLNIKRWFKYPLSHHPNKVSIYLNPFWYSQTFVGFVVCFFLRGGAWRREGSLPRWKSHPAIYPFRHCKVIAKLIRNDNANEVLQTNCMIGRLYDEEEWRDKFICFAYIPFSSLLSKYSVNPNDYSVFEMEAAFLDSNYSSNWSCGLLYKNDGSLSKVIRSNPSSNDNDSEVLEYDVFLSFRANAYDLEHFVNCLYKELNDKGIHAFKDEKPPEKGQCIASSTVLQDIQNSRMAVVVFSEEYASSAACLDKVAMIMECKEMLNQVVVPIFFGVEPSDVRGQTGSFKEAFARHEKKFKDDDEGKAKVERWRKALREAGSIDGHHLSDVPNKWRTHVSGFVDDIFEQLCSAPSILKTFVGLELRLKDISTLMQKHWKDVKLIGIWGMRGIGKTTIARATFTKFSSRFEATCFIADIRERHSKHGLKVLQERLLSYTLKEIPMPHIDDVEKGIQMIKERLKSKRVLIVLDDVDQQEQLDKLVGDGKWLCNGSRVIITTRDKNLFTQFGGALEYYEVKKLDQGIPGEKVSVSVQMAEQRDEEASMIEDGSEQALIPEKSVIDEEIPAFTQPDSGEQVQSDDHHIEEDCETIASQQELGPDRTKSWELTESVDQVQCQMVSMPECSNAKIVRLLYTNSGVGILALSSDGIQKLWKWSCNEQNPSGKATANYVPQHWQPNSGLLMINDVSGVNLKDVVPCIALSEDDSYVVSAAGRNVSLFSIMTFEVIETIMSLPCVATFLAFDPHDNNIIAIGTKKSIIYIYDREDEELIELEEHQKPITGLAFSTKLKMLVSADADAQICVWNTRIWKKRISICIQLAGGEVPSGGETQVMFHADQVQLLVTHESQLAIYDASKMERIHQWIPHDSLSARISSATYSCNGQLVYASFKDGNIRVLDADTLTLKCRISPSAYLPKLILNESEGVYPLVIAAHPQEPNQFAVGLTDGSVKVIEALESQGNWEVSPPVDNGKKNGGLVRQVLRGTLATMCLGLFGVGITRIIRTKTRKSKMNFK